jgi:hypothetical protein
MNPFWEKSTSLTMRIHAAAPSKVEVTAVASNNICHDRQGTLESTRIDYEYENMDTHRKTNASVQSHPIYLHKYLNKESAVERLHWERSTSIRAISGRTPSQPCSRHQMNGSLSSVSVKKSQMDLAAGEAHQRGSKAFERLQQSDFKWNSGSGALTDRPPLHPLSHNGKSGSSCASTKDYHKDQHLEELRRECTIRRLQQSNDSRWSSGCLASFDMAPSQVLARLRMIVGPSSVSAVNESLNDAVEIKNCATFVERRRRRMRLSGSSHRSSIFRFARSSGLSPHHKRLADREALSPGFKRFSFSSDSARNKVV